MVDEVTKASAVFCRTAVLCRFNTSWEQWKKCPHKGKHHRTPPYITSPQHLLEVGTQPRHFLGKRKGSDFLRIYTVIIDEKICAHFSKYETLYCTSRHTICKGLVTTQNRRLSWVERKERVTHPTPVMRIEEQQSHNNEKTQGCECQI